MIFTHHTSRFSKAAIVAVLTAFLLPLPASSLEAVDMEEENYEPLALFLTWQRDPATTMTIDWHTTPETRPKPPGILYREKGSAGPWKKQPGTMHPFPFTSRTVNRVELTGLEPGSTYEFRIGPPASERYPFPQSRVYSFRTMPSELDRPLRIAVGGDTGSDDNFRKLAALSRSHDLDFVVIGGDLVYADGGDRDWRTSAGEFRFAGEEFLFQDGNETKRRWISWFDILMEQFVTDEGRVIPFLPGIGNHEVWTGFVANHEQYVQNDVWRERLAPLYYNLFAFPGQPGYNVLDFGSYLSFILLDSGHTNPVYGEQKQWLQRVLTERSSVPHIFPIYHVAAWPTVRPYDGYIQTAIRDHWVPLFERHNVYIAFENHDHTYKRTFPIKNEQVHPGGVVYLGDGAFGRGGRGHRMHETEETWYLDRAAPDRHFILLTLDSDGSRFEVINIDGEIIDRYPEDGSAFNPPTR